MESTPNRVKELIAAAFEMRICCASAAALKPDEFRAMMAAMNRYADEPTCSEACRCTLQIITDCFAACTIEVSGQLTVQEMQQQVDRIPEVGPRFCELARQHGGVA